MTWLSPLERMFVEEFCRFVDVSADHIDQLRVLDRRRTLVGFMTEVDHRTVPAQFRWDAGVFDTQRVAVVGPNRVSCGSLLFFDKTTGRLDAIEGFVHGENWLEQESTAFWSEAERAFGRQGRH